MLLAALLPVTARAQTQLGPVIVTGTREPQVLGSSIADVVVIGPQDIRDAADTSVEELLRRRAGIQLTQSGGPGQTAGYFMRGASTSGTVVLVDGVRVGSATLGQAEFEALSLSQVDHIEVLRGPASSLYGADAVGGVIQIFTRKGSGPAQWSGAAAIGGYGSRQAQLGLAGSAGAFDYALQVGRESSRGVSAVRPGDVYGFYNPDADGYARDTGNLSLGYAPAAGQHIGVNLLETRLNAQYDGNPDPSLDFRNRLTTRVAAVDYRGEISPLWTASLLLSNAVDDSKSGGNSIAHYRTGRDQLTWQNALHLGAGQALVLAYEYLIEKVDADGFPGEIQRHNHGLVAGYDGSFEAHALEASLREDENSVYGSNTTGRLGYSYQLTPALKLRALAGTSFRAPTFNDLYYPQYGLPTIKPEHGRSLEAGLSWAAGSTSASATVYRNKLRDLIGYDPDPNGTDCPAGYFGCAVNTGRATLTGATLGLTHGWGSWTLHGTVDLLDARDDATGQRLTRRAAHQESLALDYAQGPWSAGASLLDVGARPDAGVRLGAYSVLDLRASWRFSSQWRLEAKLLNALDHRVEPVRDYQGLGRQAWVGVRYDGKGL